MNCKTFFIQDTEDILNNEVYRRKRSFRDVDMTDLLTAHIAEGIHYANALKDEQVTLLRRNRYSLILQLVFILKADVSVIADYRFQGVE